METELLLADEKALLIVVSVLRRKTLESVKRKNGKLIEKKLKKKLSRIK